ncbi:MAG: carboxypeptidase-like regulatory domain-containing protein, partial [Chitinophagales bacterium]
MRYYLLMLAMILSLSGWAQGRIEGKVLEAETKAAVKRVQVKLVAPTFERFTTTDEFGNYVFDNLSTAIFTIIVSEPGFFEASIDVDYVGGETKVVEDIIIEKQQQGKDMNNEIPVTEQTEDDASNSVASLLNSSRDIFVSNSMFGLGQGGFRNRGLRFQDQTLFINGVPLENIVQGNSITFNDFSGLNDVLRSRNNYYGIKAIPFTFGEQTNNIDIDAEAINQRKG